jgi:photosystem II stability/assembly factor-like uncharacterized protein
MKKSTQKLVNKIILSLMIFISLNLSAQSGWELVYSSDAWFYDMSFVAGSDGTWQTGWVITTDAEILKTTDGGDTWTVITQSETTLLNGICFVDENIGYVSSAQGKILKSTDGGLNWTTVYTGSWFGQIAFKDALNGSVAGNPNNMYTNDGGTTWYNATGPESYGRMDYASGDTYYGSGILAAAFGKSTDNGENWTNTTLDHLPIVCEFYNENIGVTGGDSWTVMHTTDGGANWTESVLNGGSGDFLCAGFFDADTIYTGGMKSIYKSTDAGTTWVQDTTMTGVNFRSMFVTGANVVFIGGEPGQIWRKIGFPPFSANFEANSTTICAGSTVDFTDLSVGPITNWNWTFEGGTPSTSTDQNPSVTYNTPGVYDVELTITSAYGTEVDLKVDYIEVLVTPEQANIPTGDEEICSNTNYSYSTDEVLYAQSYEWELSPASAGTLIENNNEVTFDVAESYTGSFSLKVRASNICGFGDWSDDFTGNINLNPTEYALEGGGYFCEGSDGVEITLIGSDLGVEYELELDGVLTGNLITGTGSPISFGLVTEVGYYQAIGFTSTCSVYMQDQVSVEVGLLPSAPATPEGPVAVCDETSSEYFSSGSEDADSYIWEISPETAGTISGTGLEAIVNWDSEYQGIAVISIAGINDCGTGSPSELEVIVGGAKPIISGEEMVCDFSSETYEVENNEGSMFEWMVTGGEIVDGQGTNMVTIDWNGEGNGNITVEEETVDGCSGMSDVFVVVIDDCTGINEDTENNLVVYPNPAKDFVILKSDAKMKMISLMNANSVLVESIHTDCFETKLNTAKLSPGLYFLKIETEKGDVFKKIILK